MRRIESRCRLDDRIVVPALLLPVPAGLVVSELDAVEPLRSLHAVEARDHHASRVAVRHRQRAAVEVIRDQNLAGVLDHFQGQAFGVTVARLERDPARLRLRRGHRDKVTQSDAGEGPRAHQVAADVVADALQGHVLAGRRQSAKVVERNAERSIHHAADAELPALAVDRRVGEVLGNDVEILHRRDGRRDASEAGLRRVEDRPIPVRSQAVAQGEHAEPGDADWHRAQHPSPAEVHARRFLGAELEHHGIDREERRPYEGCGRAVVEA